MGPWDVTELIKSIFEDYYIGTLLFWRSTSENTNLLSCEPIYGAPDKKDFDHIVLDGQQRLSALYYAFFAPDKNFPKRKSKFYYYFKIDQLLLENYDEAFFYEISSKKTDGYKRNKVIYADKCFLDDDYLEKHGITFKQIPYELKKY